MDPEFDEFGEAELVKPESVKVGVYYDFASSLCYVAHRVLERIESQLEARGIELLWRPIDLTHLVPWSRGDSFPQSIRDSVEATGQALGVDLRMPPAWLDSRPASAVAIALDGAAEEKRWRYGVFRHIFGHLPDQRASGEAPDIQALAQQLGLGSELAKETQNLDPVVTATEGAAFLGVEGVPTFLLDTWPVGGIHDDEAMLEMLSTFAERSREQAIGEPAN